MEITIEKKDNYTIVNLEGKLDSVTSGEAESKLKDLFNGEHKNIVINFEKLSYISSAGLRVLLILAKKAKASQLKLVLVSLKQEVMDVFKVSGLTKLFDIQNSVSDASF